MSTGTKFQNSELWLQLTIRFLSGPHVQLLEHADGEAKSQFLQEPERSPREIPDGILSPASHLKCLLLGSERRSVSNWSTLSKKKKTESTSCAILVSNHSNYHLLQIHFVPATMLNAFHISSYLHNAIRYYTNLTLRKPRKVICPRSQWQSGVDPT